MALKVVVADPQIYFCEVLVAALARSGIETAGFTNDELEAEALTRKHRPDVVLTELELGVGSGLSLARRLRDTARVVVLTRRRVGDVLFDVVDAGAVGCLDHGLGVEALAELLRHSDQSFVLEGSSLLEILRRASSKRWEKARGAALAKLSGREREVLRLLARGMDNDRIASALYLSAHTVRTHIGNILKKLEVHSRADAARLALDAEGAKTDPEVFRISGPDWGVG